MEIKNRVKDLTAEQRAIVLEAKEGYEARGNYEGRTLGEFVDEVMSENETITELYEEMSVWNLKWPFRLLHVDVEACTSRRFTIAVLEDETMEKLDKWSSSEIMALDPKFSLESAFEETYAAAENGDISYDYAVVDDKDRTILAFDH